MRAAPKKENHLFQIKVTLGGIMPAIWRRLIVPSDIKLSKLHEVLQVAMGWTNSHLHEFIVGNNYYKLPDEEVESDLEWKDERRYSLGQLAARKGARLIYTYDMGDAWEHVVVVEEVLPYAAKAAVPTCLDGARACPPEDVGSTPGYENFLAAIRDPKHPEHEDMLEWVGGKFDPEAFSVEEVNEQLKDVWKNGLLSFTG